MISFFPLKELNHFDAREIFMEKRIHLGNPQTDLPKHISGSTAEEEGGGQDQGDDRKRDEGELSVEVKQEEDDPDHQKNIFQKINEDRSKHLMDILDVIRQSGHQSSDRISIEKRDREVLEMGENPHPEVMHHFLTCDLHRINLREIHPEIDDENEYNEEGNVENTLDISPPQDKEVLSIQLFHAIKGNEPVGTAVLKKGGIFF